MSAIDDTTGQVHDILGVGFGPSNLALAIAVEEHDERLSAVFVERQPSFGWHRGMLIDGATMQISFLKDLVTMRDPRSSFSFLSYLQDRGRLADFINHKDFYPSRVEFHDYFAWVAARLGHVVIYGTEAVGITPVFDGDGVLCRFAVHTTCATGERTYLATNVVLATGLRPHLPAGITGGDRVWHNYELLDRLPELRRETPRPRRLAVVGAGQSAAEVAEYLHRMFPTANVPVIFLRYGFSPADDSPFANRIFDPRAVDDFFMAATETKQALLRYHANTNYSAVDLDLIQELYRRHYQERVTGRERLQFINGTQVVAVDGHRSGVRLTLAHRLDGTTSVMDTDAVVFATGYRPPDYGQALQGLNEVLIRDADGRPAVGRDYRVHLRATSLGGIYLQGGTEHSHGMTASLLSLSAIRASEILAAINRKEPNDHQVAR